MIQASVAYEVPQMGMGPGDYAQPNGFFQQQKGVVYLQQAQPMRAAAAGGVRLVQQQPQLLAPVGGQQQVWVQAAPSQQQVVQVQNMRPHSQYVVQQQLQPQPQQQQVVYLQQQPAQPQQLAPQQLAQQQPALQQVFKPVQHVVQHQAPSGQPAPGSTVLVNINGTLRQAIVGQNGALFLMDSAKPAMAAQPAGAQQAAQPAAVQYVTMQQQPQAQAQLQQQQRMQMVLQQGSTANGTGIYLQPQQAGMGGPQYVTVQQAQQMSMRSVPVSAAQMSASLRAVPGTAPVQMAGQPQQQQQQQQPMLLAANGTMLQQQPQHQMAAIQQRPAVQLANMMSASKPMVSMAQAPASTIMMMPQQLGAGVAGGAPVSAATVNLGGGLRPMMAPPSYPALSAAMVAPLPALGAAPQRNGMSSAMELPALQAQAQQHAQAQAQAAHAQQQTAGVGVIGDARRSRTGSSSSPQSPMGSTQGSQPGSPPRAGTPRQVAGSMLAPIPDCGAPMLAGLAGLLNGDLSALGGKDAVLRLIASSALEAGMSPDQAIMAGMCRPADKDALVAAFASESARAAGGATSPVPAVAAAAVAAAANVAAQAPMSADAMLEGFASNGSKPQAMLSDLSSLHGQMPNNAPSAPTNGTALPGAPGSHAQDPPHAGGLGGMFNAFGFSLFGGPYDGGVPPPAGAAKTVSDDGIPGGAQDQRADSLLPVAMATLKMPGGHSAPHPPSNVISLQNGSNAGALASLVAGLNLNMGDLNTAAAAAAAAPQKASA